MSLNLSHLSNLWKLGLVFLHRSFLSFRRSLSATMDPNLLRECAQRLLETADFIRNRTAAVTSTTPTTTTTTSNLTNAPGTAQPQPNSATVRSEHNRLFGYRPPAPSRAPRNPRANSRGTRRSPYTNAAVGRASSTWSRSFVCIATAGQQTPPSTSERIDLSLNGLGEKKLSFPKEGNAGDVHETILAAFPALREGYEILRAGEGRSRQLLLIPMPSNGFSVGYLQSVLGQAKGYLRPLQRDIEMDTRQEGVASPEKVCQLSSPRGIGRKAWGGGGGTPI